MEHGQPSRNCASRFGFVSMPVARRGKGRRQEEQGEIDGHDSGVPVGRAGGGNDARPSWYGFQKASSTPVEKGLAP